MNTNNTMHNHAIINADHLAHAASLQPTQQQVAEQTKQNHNPLIHIVLTEAHRAVHFIAGMVGGFFNAHQGPVNLAMAEPVTGQSANAIEEEYDYDEDDYYPQTPNPVMYPSRSERSQVTSSRTENIPRTPNPPMFQNH